MKIKAVDALLFSYPFEKPIHLTYYGGQRQIFKRDAMLIRVETDNGLVGYAPGQGTESAQATIQTKIAPFLVGHALADADALRVKFAAAVHNDLKLIKTYSSVEVALYDLLGKAHGVPVSELLGGRVRDRIRLYGSAGMYMKPEEYAAEAAAVQKLGFTAYKMRPALGPEGDLETVRRMREATGPDFELMVDAHTWWRMGDRTYDFDTIKRLAEQFAEFNIAWLEEPVPPEDHEKLLELRQADTVPIASGEHEPSEERFLDLIQTGSVDYVQMDIVCQGGYPTAKRIFAEAAREGLKFAFHSWGSLLEVAAAAQVGVCWPETTVEWLEYPCYSTDTRAGMYAFPPAEEIVREPLQIENGELVVSRGPGLGVTVDESIIGKYPWIPGPWSSFTIDSPRETWSVTGDHSVRWAEK